MPAGAQTHRHGDLPLTLGRQPNTIKRGAAGQPHLTRPYECRLTVAAYPELVGHALTEAAFADQRGPAVMRESSSEDLCARGSLRAHYNGERLLETWTTVRLQRPGIPVLLKQLRDDSPLR